LAPADRSLQTLRRLNLRKAQAAHLNTIRDINRQIVLNYVREREPISRAEIARETSLQRSTISAIVESLKDEGLIEEVGAGESTGGRRPTLLRLRTVGAIALGVAITPTSTIVASSDLAGRVIEQQEFPTDPNATKTFKQIIDCVRQFSQKNRSIESIGISIPGLVDPAAGSAIYVPYFFWRDLPVTEIVSSGSGLPVTIDNDANAAALAELWFGRPEVIDARDFILVLVAEGVGTGIIFDGQVYRGQGAAGEFGHMIIGSNAPAACSCGSHECWEAFSSDRASLARYQKLTGDNTDSTGLGEVVDRALRGETPAKMALIETARHLGVGISNLIVGFSPEAVVVGGEIARAWTLVEDALNEPMKRSVRRGLPSARILPSTLGPQPTLMGALSLVLAKKFAAAFAA
jgi:predicted NBD/HSP70 family sugar kinase